MRSVIVTDDGSHSILDSDRQVTYHSSHGAIAESRHIYIEHGLAEIAKQVYAVSVLEVGFGTGLNAYLTYLFSREHTDISIRYTGVEKFPLAPEIVAQLNYVTQLKAESYQDVFTQMHTQQVFEDDRFQLTTWVGDVADFQPLHSYHLIYFDAFAPQVYPEMWTSEIFQKLSQHLAPGGILVTFSAQGQFKRTLRTLGFDIESLPGPVGKREMVRAFKV